MSDSYRLKKSSASSPEVAPGEKPARRRAAAGRLVSLDAFRGFIMLMLAAEGFGISDFARLPEDAPVWQSLDYDFWQRIAFHFRHPPWVSVNTEHWVAFWDLIQPAFMFMVGVAMPFSYAKRAESGESTVGRLLHALLRAVILVLLGVFLYSMNNERTNWIFFNVLAQIGLGYFFVYLLLGRSRRVQIGAIAVILAGTWALFHFNPPPADTDYEAVEASAEAGEVFTGRFAAWSKNANFAHEVDQWLLPRLRRSQEAAASDPAEDPDDRGLLQRLFFSNPEPWTYNGGGYTTFNFVPSIATMLLGVLCGQLLLTRPPPLRTLMILLGAGALCVGAGLLAHVTICPIVKRIWTPSWVLFSGGCVIWMLAVFYVLFDVLPFRKLAFPLTVVGMNSLAVYMAGSLIHGWMEEHIVQTHLAELLMAALGPNALADDMYGRLVGPACVVLLMWLMAFWMYRQRIFVRV